MDRPADVPEWYEYGTIYTYKAQAGMKKDAKGNQVPSMHYLYIASTPSGRLEEFYDGNMLKVKNLYGAAGWLFGADGEGNFSPGMIGEAPDWLQASFSSVAGARPSQYYSWYQIRRRHSARAD